MKHEQKIKHTTWKISHDFDHKPAIKCWVDVDGDLIRIIPQNIIFREGEVEIILSRPYLGEAILTNSNVWYKE